MRKLAGRAGASRRIIGLAGFTAVVLIGAASTVLADPGGWFAGNDNAWPYSSVGRAPVLATVGDISCQPGSPVEAEKSTDTCDQGTGSTVRDARRMRPQGRWRQ